jgi:hypothetical protein
MASSLRPRSREASPKRRKLDPERACTASATFSSAEKPGRIEVIWKERASPRCTRCARESPVTSAPSNRMRPESLGARPEIWWMRVVLPAPLGPMIACSSPGRMSRLTSSVTTRAP